MPPGMRAGELLRSRVTWFTAAAIASVLIFLMTLIYVGSIVNPIGHLHDLPVLIVNEDRGAAAGSSHVDLGEQVVAAQRGSSAVSSRLSLELVTLAAAKEKMDVNGAYATVVIPPDFTTSTLALYGLAPTSSRSVPLPAISLLTNVRAGSLGVSLATGVLNPALAAISLVLGHQVGALAPAGAIADPALTALRSNPITITTTPYRPLPPSSALGLSAFYLSLLTIMCGFLAGTLINTSVDSTLGYATNEVGPKWMQRAPVLISRFQTLLAKWVMALVLPPLLVAIVLLVAVGILNMDAPSVLLLWAFLSCGAVVIAMGTLVLFAAFGNLGQLIAMLLFIYLALASSGGTIPLQALPPVLRFTASFEPLRQILDGTRSILYFNSSGAAGLTRGFVLTGFGLILWLVVGVAVTRWYDRRGLDRMNPDLIEYLRESADAYSRGERGSQSPA